MSSTKGLHAPLAPAPRDSHFDPVSLLRRSARRWMAVIKEAAVRWTADCCYRMGASLAYFAFFSLFPLLLIAITVLGFFLDSAPASREKLLGALAGTMSPDFRNLLDETLASMQAHRTARGIGAAIGGLALVFGASGVFSELETSLRTIWRVAPVHAEGLRDSLLHALKVKALSFAAVFGAGAVLLSSLVVSTGLGALTSFAEEVLPGVIVWRVFEVCVSIGLTTLLFAVIFRLLPRIDVVWSDVIGGAFLTAILFNLQKYLLSFYLVHIGSYAAYGAVGGVLALLMWIYLVCLIVFFGAEVTRVYAEREGSLAKGDEDAPAHPTSGAC